MSVLIASTLLFMSQVLYMGRLHFFKVSRYKKPILMLLKKYLFIILLMFCWMYVKLLFWVTNVNVTSGNTVHEANFRLVMIAWRRN